MVVLVCVHALVCVVNVDFVGAQLPQYVDVNGRGVYSDYCARQLGQFSGPLCKPGVLLDLLNCDSFFWFGGQYSLNQVCCFR